MFELHARGAVVLAFSLLEPFSDFFFHQNKPLSCGVPNDIEIVYPMNILKCSKIFIGTEWWKSFVITVYIFGALRISPS